MMGKNVAVIGSGTMGCGIAHAALAAGNSVILVGHSEEGIANGKLRLNASLDKAVAKGAMSAEGKLSAMGKALFSYNIRDVKDCEIIIEAITENIKEKEDVISKIESYSREDALIATNTSAIRIDTLSSALQNKTRFIGLHFFNPVPVMKLVEVVKGKETSPDTIVKANAFIKDMGKTAVDINDYPGFIANRILMPYINEAAKAFGDGVASREGIDAIAKMGFNHPMGPLALADLIGIDVCKDIMDVIYEQTADPAFKAAELLSRMVADGKLGRKAGRGFYEYAKS